MKMNEEGEYRTVSDTAEKSAVTVTGIPSYIMEYTGNPITFASLAVQYNHAALTKDTDYTVTYSNNTDPGIASVVIQGTGSYSFRRDIAFTIINNNEDPDYSVTPPARYSDTSAGQTAAAALHNGSIESRNFNQAIALLDEHQLNGFRAQTMNEIQEKLKHTQSFLLDKRSPRYYEYSRREPGNSGLAIWAQEYERDPRIYGVEVDFKTGSFVRLEEASGKQPGSDFDGAGPFMRRRCNLSDDGSVLAYYGEPHYAEDGKLGQVMVEQPAFYYRIEPLSLEPAENQTVRHLRKARYFVSAAKHRGFKLHPAFICGDTVFDSIYLSAFEGCLYDTSAGMYITDDAQTADFSEDRLSSISGVKPLSGRSQAATRAHLRAAAHNRGKGWEQSYAATVSASQLLMLIEYASFDMQSSIGMGCISKSNSGTSNMAEHTGGTAGLGNASGAVYNKNGIQIISYRGEENLWGNIWTWTDGMNVKNPSAFAEGNTGRIYVADHDFKDNTDKAPYRETGLAACYGAGYISAFGYSEEYDWLFIPSEMTGNSSDPVGDYFENEYPSWRIVKSGAKWNDNTEAGAFCWSMNNDSSVGYQGCGGRLVYVPRKAPVY